MIPGRVCGKQRGTEWRLRLPDEASPELSPAGSEHHETTVHSAQEIRGKVLRLWAWGPGTGDTTAGSGLGQQCPRGPVFCPSAHTYNAFLISKSFSLEFIALFIIALSSYPFNKQTCFLNQ